MLTRCAPGEPTAHGERVLDVHYCESGHRQFGLHMGVGEGCSPTEADTVACHGVNWLHRFSPVQGGYWKRVPVGTVDTIHCLGHDHICFFDMCVNCDIFSIRDHGNGVEAENRHMKTLSQTAASTTVGNTHRMLVGLMIENNSETQKMPANLIFSLLSKAHTMLDDIVRSWHQLAHHSPQTRQNLARSCLRVWQNGRVGRSWRDGTVVTGQFAAPEAVLGEGMTSKNEGVLAWYSYFKTKRPPPKTGASAQKRSRDGLDQSNMVWNIAVDCLTLLLDIHMSTNTLAGLLVDAVTFHFNLQRLGASFETECRLALVVAETISNCLSLSFHIHAHAFTAHWPSTLQSGRPIVADESTWSKLRAEISRNEGNRDTFRALFETAARLASIVNVANGPNFQ